MLGADPDKEEDSEMLAEDESVAEALEREVKDRVEEEDKSEDKEDRADEEDKSIEEDRTEEET
jgi:hypothetical protein